MGTQRHTTEGVETVTTERPDLGKTITRRRGAPSKLTPAMMVKITELIAGGALTVDACHVCGISPTTFHQWVAKGRKGNIPEYKNFVEALELAEARRRTELTATIRTASKDPKHWPAAAWILSHTDTAQYAPKIRVHVEAELQSALSRLEEEFRNDPEIYERVLNAIAGGNGSAQAPRLAAEAGEEGVSEGANVRPPITVDASASVSGPRR